MKRTTLIGAVFVSVLVTPCAGEQVEELASFPIRGQEPFKLPSEYPFGRPIHRGSRINTARRASDRPAEAATRVPTGARHAAPPPATPETTPAASPAPSAPTVPAAQRFTGRTCVLWLMSIGERLKRRFSPLSIDPTVHRAEQYYGAIYLGHIRRALAELDAPPLRILDVGCGAGRLLIPLAMDGHDVTGIEFHRDSARSARERLAALPDLHPHRPTARVVSADVTSYLADVPSNSIDAIVAIEVLYLNPSVPDLLNEFRRVLRPGGLLIASHRTRFYYLALSILHRHFDDARTVVEHGEGHLRKGASGFRRVYYNWQSPSDLPALYAAAGLRLDETHPIGSFSGFGPDPFTGLCDPSALDDDALEQLREVEMRNSTEALATARYLLTVATAD